MMAYARYLDFEIKKFKRGAMQPPPDSSIALLNSLLRATNTLQETGMRPVANLSLCHSDFSILQTLLRDGSQPVNTLGKQVFLTSGSITTAIDRLEQRGYVERKPDTKDRRVCLVTLTNHGRAIMNQASLSYSEAIQQATSSLSKHECELLQSLLGRIGLFSDVERPTQMAVPTKPTQQSSEMRAVEQNHFEGFTGLD